MKSLRILAIDDNPTDLDLLRIHLKRIEAEVTSFTTCSDPAETMLALQEEEFDVILLDFHLGSMSGIELMQKIHAAGYDYPIIMLTGCGDERTAVSCLQAGAAEYLPKDRLSANSIKRCLSHAFETYSLRKEVQKKKLDLEASNSRLAHRNDELLRFYQVLAHELKTPLASAKEFVAIVLDEIAGPINCQQREYLEIAKQSCDQMVSNIRCLLDAAHLESGKLAYTFDTVYIKEELNRVIQSLLPNANKLGINLFLDVDSEVAQAYCDADRIRQVVTNLIHNSLKFTPSGGTIKISAQVTQQDSGDFVAIEVNDSGMGIDSEKLSQIFERFYQVNGEEFDKGEGLGLGLSVCSGIITGHGGTITVDSEIGLGSTFCFSIPCSKSVATLQESLKDEENTYC